MKRIRCAVATLVLVALGLAGCDEIGTTGTQVVSVSLSTEFNCALVRATTAGGMSDASMGGEVRCWDAELQARNLVPAVENAVALAMGNPNCLVRDDGVLACWGRNNHGQLGNGTTVERDRPVAVDLPLGDSEVVAMHRVAVSRFGPDGFACAASDAVVWCWGANTRGQLGDGTRQGRRRPVRVASLDERTDPQVAAVTLGGEFACALIDASVWCWGANDAYQCGQSNRQDQLDPVRVGLAEATGSVLSVSAGRRHACWLDEIGTVWCWGANDRQQLGARGPASPEPVRVPELVASQVVAGAEHSCAQVGDDLVCWGANDHGQIRSGPLEVGPASLRLGELGLNGPLGAAAGPTQTCAWNSMSMRCWGSFGPSGSPLDRADVGPAASSLPRLVRGL